MGASFRNSDEILQLAGCDYLTIAPSLMEELRNSDDEVIRRLDPVAAKQREIPRLEVNEAGFRWHMNEDAMATEKLAEGIRNFTKDTLKLEEFACRACASH